MKHLSAKIRNFIAEETAGEVLEYAALAGLIVVVAIVAISQVGSKVLANWSSLDGSM